MLDLCSCPFSRKQNVSQLAEGADAISLNLPRRRMLFTDVPFYLAFGVANLFRDKNKLSQSLNIISYKTLLVKQSLDLTVVTSREVAKMAPMPSRICSFSVMIFHRHTLLPSKFLYFFPLSLRKWV